MRSYKWEACERGAASGGLVAAISKRKLRAVKVVHKGLDADHSEESPVVRSVA